MKDKSLKELVVRLNQIETEKNELDLEYNMIVHELWNRIPSLKEDVNVQLKQSPCEVIDKMLNETYKDELDEYTRIYPLRECCKERLKVVRKRVRKYESK